MRLGSVVKEPLDDDCTENPGQASGSRLYELVKSVQASFAYSLSDPAMIRLCSEICFLGATPQKTEKNMRYVLLYGVLILK